MRNYEALYIIKPELEKEQIEAVVAKFSQLIPDNGGELIKVDEWGKRRLAYEVKKYREGYYVLMQFKGEASVTRELERIFKISDDVIRQLIVKLEDEELVEEKQEETAAE